MFFCLLVSPSGALAVIEFEWNERGAHAIEYQRFCFFELKVNEIQMYRRCGMILFVNLWFQ